MRRRSILVVAIMALLLVSACGSSGPESAPQAQTTTAATAPAAPKANHIQENSISTPLRDNHTLRMYRQGSGSSIEIDRRGDLFFVLFNRVLPYTDARSIMSGPIEIDKNVWVNPDGTVNYLTAEMDERLTQYVYFAQPGEVGPWKIHPTGKTEPMGTITIEGKPEDPNGRLIAVNFTIAGKDYHGGSYEVCGNCPSNADEAPDEGARMVWVGFTGTSKKGHIQYPLDWTLERP